MILCWLVLWHNDHGKSSALRFRVPGQFRLAIRVWRAARARWDDGVRMSVEW